LFFCGLSGVVWVFYFLLKFIHFLVHHKSIEERKVFTTSVFISGTVGEIVTMPAGEKSANLVENPHPSTAVMTIGEEWATKPISFTPVSAYRGSKRYPTVKSLLIAIGVGLCIG
jgi:hypothetical protein